MNSGEKIKQLMAGIDSIADLDIWIDDFFEPLKEKILEIGGSEESVMGYFATELVEREFQANHFAFMFMNYGVDFDFYDFALMGYIDFLKNPEAAKVLQEAIALANVHKKEIEAIKKMGKSKYTLEKASEFKRKGIFNELDEKGDKFMWISNEDRIKYIKEYAKDFIELANEAAE